MLRVFNKRLIAIVLLAFVAAACDDDDSTTPITPTVPKTESFSGVLVQNRSEMHNFDVGGAGAVVATLKAIGSDNTLVVNFALGTWTGSACSIVLENPGATGGAILNGTMTGMGTLCARVGDIGNVPAGPGVTYTIEVVHP